MKRITIFTALSFLLTLGFAGCSQEEVTQPEQEQEIRVAFTTDAIKTRVNTLDTGDEWENGDQILVVNTASNVDALMCGSAMRRLLRRIWLSSKTWKN